jgi:hypothetical protein
MPHLHFRNASEAFRTFPFHTLHFFPEDTRNGRADRLGQPLIVTYEKPTERFFENPVRNPNPFFHLFECLWMLAGSNQVAPLSKFTSQIAQFSDDGKIFNGAYGHRWRNWFGYDQIETIISMLKTGPTRRAVLSMFDGRYDLGAESKDIPCNLSIVFGYRQFEDDLEMTVFNRSNDIILGMFGANVVHMSFLHEFIARASDMKVGPYHQISANAHVYHSSYEKLGVEGRDHMTPVQSYTYDRYNVSRPYPILLSNEPWESFLEDCSVAMKFPVMVNDWKTNWFRKVWEHVQRAFWLYKQDNIYKAMSVLDSVKDKMIQDVCQQWLMRIKVKRNERRTTE